ncbi:MAG: VOC family protein [Gemmatimonadetes bacterium]|nr:VOC family protein [Gemmatimonadota bacterium]
MNRVVHFEIHAAEPKRAAEFYRAVFGWEIKEWVLPGIEMPNENRYWRVTTGSGDAPGIDGGIVFRRADAPVEGQAVNSYVCTIGVASVDGSVDAVRAAGGHLAVPKMPIIGVGWLAYCKDPEGNIFGVMQDDPGAG